MIKWNRNLALACLLAAALPVLGYSQTPAPDQPAAAVNPGPGRPFPAEALKELQTLVHEGNYEQAQLLTANLLALYPNDQRLLQAKALLEKAIAKDNQLKTSARSRPSGPGTAADAPPAPVEPDQAEYDRLLELTRQAKQTTDGARQQALLRQFMNESRAFVEKHPDRDLIWEIRAASALVLNDMMAGYEAGQKLVARGALESGNENLRHLIALLKNRGWLDEQRVVTMVESAKYLTGKPHTTSLADNVAMDFVWIAPGTFTMGSPESERGRSYNESPQTAVTISHGYWLGKTPVTQGQYQALMGSSPNYFREAGPEAPVSHIEWEDAQEYCRRLTGKEREAGQLPSGYEYRLPTEAEWEYACRAGTTGTSYSEDIDAIAWNSTNNRSGVYLPVGKKRPNAWGLHEMFGGGWEWCLDWYGPYLGLPVTDPRGPESGKGHIYRGTYPYEDPDNCRAAKRNSSDHSFAYSGFRVALCVIPPGQ